VFPPIFDNQPVVTDRVEEMALAVQAYPCYLWGWSLLVDWLVEDQAWEQAR
jgi:hypothetical protein